MNYLKLATPIDAALIDPSYKGSLVDGVRIIEVSRIRMDRAEISIQLGLVNEEGGEAVGFIPIQGDSIVASGPPFEAVAAELLLPVLNNSFDLVQAVTAARSAAEDEKIAAVVDRNAAIEAENVTRAAEDPPLPPIPLNPIPPKRHFDLTGEKQIDLKTLAIGKP